MFLVSIAEAPCNETGHIYYPLAVLSRRRKTALPCLFRLLHCGNTKLPLFPWTMRSLLLQHFREDGDVSLVTSEQEGNIIT